MRRRGVLPVFRERPFDGGLGREPVIFVPSQAHAERVRLEDPDGGFPHDKSRVIVRIRGCKPRRCLVPENRKGGNPACEKEYPSPSPSEPPQEKDPHRRDHRDEHRPGCGERKRGTEEEKRSGDAHHADPAPLPLREETGQAQQPGNGHEFGEEIRVVERSPGTEIACGVPLIQCHRELQNSDGRHREKNRIPRPIGIVANDPVRSPEDDGSHRDVQRVLHRYPGVDG